MQTQFADDNEQNVRSQLLEKTAPSLWANDGDDDYVEPLSAPIQRSSAGQLEQANVNDFRRQQERMLEEQDEGLDTLAKTISRQKHLALRIGDEVDEQNGEALREGIQIFHKYYRHSY